jgi:hypothetical protein
MASNINIQNINTNYPVAGEDNDTQGFRDNFTVISDNLEFAKQEIDDLQLNSLRSDSDNDLFGNILENATLQTAGIFYYDNGNVDADTDILFSNGQFQTVSITNDIILRILDWPTAEIYSSILVAIKSDGEDRQLIIREFENQTLKFDDLFPENIIISSEDDYEFFEIFSFDQGETLQVEYKGKYSNDFLDAKKFRNIEAEDVQINGNLTVTGETSLTDISIPSQLELLENVEAENVQDKQILRYNNDTGNWESSDQEKTVNYSITIQESTTENGQSRFFIDGTEITELSNFTLDSEKIYRFDISDSSNAQAPLRISTTPDTDPPTSITPYTTNVQIIGSAGEEGSYLEIKVDEDTPSELYFYGEQVFLNTSFIGGGEDGKINIGIKRKIGVFEKVISNLDGDVEGNVVGTVSDVSNHDTDDIVEGENNLYYTDTRVINQINDTVSQNFVNNLELDAKTFESLGLSEFALLNSENVFASDVTIEGNLIVQDNTITVTSSNLLTLNNDVTVADTPTQDVGIEIQRGVEDNKFFLWRESENLWSLINDNLEAGGFYGNLYGSVLADDTTLLVDAENGTINYSVLTGQPTSLTDFDNDIDYSPIISNEISSNGIPATTVNGSLDVQGNNISNVNLVNATGDIVGSVFADDSSPLLLGNTGEFVGISRSEKFIIPNLTQAERDTYDPELGEMIYNIDAAKIQVYVQQNDSTQIWIDLN